MESFDAKGERVTAPVYGRGDYERSKYIDYPSADLDGEIVYGNPYSHRAATAMVIRFSKFPMRKLRFARHMRRNKKETMRQKILRVISGAKYPTAEPLATVAYLATGKAPRRCPGRPKATRMISFM